MSTCPTCGAPCPAPSDFTDDPTPVDARFERYAEGNLRVLEDELRIHKEEARRAAADLEKSKAEVTRLQAVEVENEALRRQVAQLKLALAGRNRKG